MMVFITPSCRRINLLRWLSGVLALWCGAALATTEGIHVKSAELSVNGSEYYLEANFEVGLTPTLEDALNRGLPLHFVMFNIYTKSGVKLFHLKKIFLKLPLARVCRYNSIYFAELT